MIVCAGCGYPNDEQEHRCERCGRRFPGFFPSGDDWGEEEGLLVSSVAGAQREETETEAVTAPLAPSAPPDPVWRDELTSRIERFRRRRAAQASLPLEFGPVLQPVRQETPVARASEPAVRPLEAPVLDRSAKVIPFEQIAGARIAPLPQVGPEGMKTAETPRPTPPEPASRTPEREVAGPAVAPAIEPRSTPDQGGWPVPGEKRAPAKGWPVPGETREAGREPDPAPLSAWAALAKEAGRRAVKRGIRHRGGDTLSNQSAFTFPDPAPPVTEDAVEVAVAPLVVRVMAGAADAALLAGGYAVFFVVYALIGGKFVLRGEGLAALAVAVGLVGATYLYLFLRLAASTPGMHWTGLSLVDFEGGPARASQRVLRVVGLMASAAALGFGFLWSLADEDGLGWHDRISRTCLTLRGL